MVHESINGEDCSRARYIVELTRSGSNPLKSRLDVRSKLVDDESEPPAIPPVLFRFTSERDVIVFTFLPRPVWLIAKPEGSRKDGLSDL